MSLPEKLHNNAVQQNDAPAKSFILTGTGVGTTALVELSQQCKIHCDTESVC